MFFFEWTPILLFSLSMEYTRRHVGVDVQHVDGLTDVAQLIDVIQCSVMPPGKPYIDECHAVRSVDMEMSAP
jgi:hypothetical protein